jgi:phosphoribosylamine--glycine ligase
MRKMKVLILGSGGREHAIAWKLSQSQKVEKIYCCPGNAGTEKIYQNVNISLKDFSGLVKFVKDNNVNLTVVGPEAPLSEGIVDYFNKFQLLVFGPRQKAAEIESSKAFAKDLMNKYNIPTARYKIFTEFQYDEIRKYIREHEFPIVIKADGLAAGKGVIIANSYEVSDSAITEIVKNKSFGSAGNKIVIEEFLSGEEASVFAITDGKDFITLPAAQDHKRIFDNDEGKNTGGMGAYAPTGLITEKMLDEVIEKIIKPTLKGMTLESRSFTGCLYCGLIITKDGPKVIEFNCRFGDPETQAVLPLISSDFFDLLYLSAIGKIKDYKIKLHDSTAVCVVLASKGYPDIYETAKIIYGLDTFTEENDDVFIFHAGTKTHEEKILSSGGRVLGVTTLVKGKDLTSAMNKSYQYINKISFDGMQYRTDIGKKGLKYCS